MAGASGSTFRTGPHHLHLARETRRLSWALKIYSTSPSVRGVAHWASSRPQRWRWLEACHIDCPTAWPPLMNERTNEQWVHCCCVCYTRVVEDAFCKHEGRSKDRVVACILFAQLPHHWPQSLWSALIFLLFDVLKTMSLCFLQASLQLQKPVIVHHLYLIKSVLFYILMSELSQYALQCLINSI